MTFGTKANSNRTADWVKQANQDIANLLIKPLQTTINDVAMAAGFLALVPGLEPLMVVAGAASLLNAGISAMEGNYMSAGMYGVFALIPAGGEIADVGDVVQGTTPAVEDAVPAAQTAIEDAGQEEASTLEAENVESSCREGPGCFFAGTQVITGVNADGTYQTRQIQNIAVGAGWKSRVPQPWVKGITGDCPKLFYFADWHSISMRIG